MSSNRETVRDGLTTLLSAALTGTGGIAQAVYGYRIGELAGASPVVTVSSQGILRRPMTFQGTRATVYLQVDVFVIYSDGGSWNEDEAEDRIDAIEAAIAGVVDANQKTAYWKALSYAERSQRVDVVIGGVDYIREVIVLEAEVFG